MLCIIFFFFQAEDGIRDLVRSRGLGDVYKRQSQHRVGFHAGVSAQGKTAPACPARHIGMCGMSLHCLLYTTDAADERSSVDLGGRRIFKKKKRVEQPGTSRMIEEKKDNM